MKDGTIHSARGFTNAGYHNVRALPAVLATIGSPRLEGLIPEHIVLAVKAAAPGIDYGSRQHLEEYRAGLAALLNNPNIHFPVYIYWQNERGERFIYQTDTKEWLPLPFTAAEFGMNDQLSKSFESAFLNQ